MNNTAPVEVGEKDIPICHYCKKRPAKNQWIYFAAKLYWINKRTVFPMGYNYTEKTVMIPRCSKCEAFHENTLIKCSLVGFPIGYGFAVWGMYKIHDNSFVSDDGSWFGPAFGIFFWGTLLTGIIMRVMEFYLTHRSVIPSEDDFFDYPVVEILLHEGWILNRPDAADHPETGEERRKRLIQESDIK
jgi:hypothetical protein